MLQGSKETRYEQILGALGDKGDCIKAGVLLELVSDIQSPILCRRDMAP